MPYKKLTFYRPGLISLIGMPIMMLFLMPPAPKDEVCLNLNLPSDKRNTSDSTLRQFTRDLVYNDAKKHKIETIYWDEFSEYMYDDEEYRNSNLKKFILHEIERLQYTRDTSAVLKIVLSGDNTYGDIVGLINLARIYHYKRYALVDNEFYMFPNDPPPIIDHSKDSLLYINFDLDKPYVSNEKPLTEWELFKLRWSYKLEYQITVFKANYLILLGFLFLIVVPWIFFISNNKKKGIMKEVDN